MLTLHSKLPFNLPLHDISNFPRESAMYGAYRYDQCVASPHTSELSRTFPHMVDPLCSLFNKLTDGLTACQTLAQANTDSIILSSRPGNMFFHQTLILLAKQMAPQVKNITAKVHDHKKLKSMATVDIVPIVLQKTCSNSKHRCRGTRDAV